VVYSDGASEIHRQPQPKLEQTGLKRVQRKLARRKKVSNRRRIKLRIGKLHRKIRNIGNAWGHRLTRAIASKARLLVLEKLHTQAMTASATGAVENSGSNVKAESGLNRSVPSAG